MRRKLLFSLIFLVWAGFLGAQNTVSMRHQALGDGGFQIFVDNPTLVPVSIQITFSTLEGLDPSLNPKDWHMVPGQAKDYPFLLLKSRGGRTRFSYNWKWIQGDVASGTQGDGFLYWIPFRHGTKHSVGQGWFGTFSHTGDSEYAIDFTMDEGTPILAARDGLVIDVKEDSQVGGTSADNRDDGNYITVFHTDGTFAQYVHLEYMGVHVEVGERVRAGQEIGSSGNTGYSSGPHLHFVVLAPTPEGWRSIPVRFRGMEGESLELEEGKWYYAAHPGKPEFPVILGHTLTDDDFADLLDDAPSSGKVEVVTEKIDDTVIFYAINGVDKPMKVTLDLTLSNMMSTRGRRIIQTLQPLTRVYLGLIRKDQARKAYSYKYQYRYGPP